MSQLLGEPALLGATMSYTNIQGETTGHMQKELNKLDNLDALLEGGKDGQQMAKIPFISKIAAY